MPSLRRSLTLYLLALFGLGLGAVAVLTDRLMDRTLLDKERAETAAIARRAKDAREQAEEQFEQLLHDRAREIAKGIQTKYEAEPARIQTAQTLLMLAPGGFGPGASLGTAVWLTGISHRRFGFGPLWGPVAREYFLHLQSGDQFSYLTDDDEHPAYVQINDSRGRVWKSRGLKDQKNFPGYEPASEKWNPKEWAEEKLDKATLLPNGQMAWRAVHKVILTRSVGWNWSQRPPSPGGSGGRGERGERGGGRPPQGPPPPPSQAGSMPPPPTETIPIQIPRLFIHYARPVAELTAKLDQIQAEANHEMAELLVATARTRTNFRVGLAAIGGLTFLAILIGSPFLVHRGLAPVRTLSDAVGRVSEKDFRLPVEANRMSSELLPIHARLSDTLDALRRAFDREKQAVADISHELRTPVAGLQATLDVALRKPRTAEQYKASLEDARTITRQLGHLVERVMTLAWLDSGGESIAAVETDAAAVVAGCATTVRSLATANDLTLETEESGPVPVVTDPDKLREVVTNLLHNAIEYNRPGGSIRVATHSTTDGGAEIEVADTGIGMTPDVRKKIFERFFRADASRHAAGVHAGLGLSIVKEYVERLGGTITVESESGVGSTFRVKFPGHPPAEPSTQPEELAAV